VEFSRFLCGFVENEVLHRYDRLMDILSENMLQDPLNKYLEIY
jgi:hypothetical protein